MPLKILLSILLFISSPTYGQKQVNISGNISGLHNLKIYLGNKPNGIGKGFHYIIYDSVLSEDGNFLFKNFKFKEPDFHSIQIEGSAAWLPFLIDTGNIFITARKDSIWNGIVSGSKENELYLFYRNNISKTFYKDHEKNFDSIAKYKVMDSSKANYYSELNKKLESQLISQEKEYIKKHPSNVVSLIILSDIERQLPKDSFALYYKALSPQLQNNSKAKDLKYLAGDFYKNTQVASLVPNFQFKDVSGNNNNLYSIHAPYKLIVFWASWCGPCIAELPELKEFHSKNKDVTIISYSIDFNVTDWIRSSKENEIPWYSFSASKGTEGKFPTYFRVLQIPFMLLLDAQNKILKYNIGMSEIEEYFKSK